MTSTNLVHRSLIRFERHQKSRPAVHSPSRVVGVDEWTGTHRTPQLMVGIETWARQMKHADGITWFLSKLEAEARDDPDSELLWSVPTARSDRAYNWGR